MSMTIVVSSTAWTGRAPYAADGPIELLRWRMRRFLFPTFNCEDCIGMADHGCYCAAYDAVAPGVPAEPWREFLRRLLRFDRLVVYPL